MLGFSAHKLRASFVRLADEIVQACEEIANRLLPLDRIAADTHQHHRTGAFTRCDFQRDIFYEPESWLRGRACPTNGSDRGSLCSRDLTLFVRPDCLNMLHPFLTKVAYYRTDCGDN